MDRTVYAAQRFQWKLQAAERNGLTREEAEDLVKKHNWLQIQSRQELILLLKKHGHIAGLDTNMVTLDRKFGKPAQLDIEIARRKVNPLLRFSHMDYRKFIWLVIVGTAEIFALAGLVGLI